MLRRQVELFLCAVQFLTRLPVPRLAGFEPEWVTRSARYFPLVGQLVGAISALALAGGAAVWTGPAAAVLAVGVGVLATGAFHEDGLADSVDGLFGGQTPEGRLEIMRDSRIGTYGALALLLVLGLKIAVLAGAPPWRAAVWLIAAHGAGRAAATVVMRLTPYAPAGEPGKWKPVPEGVRWSEAAAGLLIALWPLALMPRQALTAVLGGTVGAAGLALLARRRLGGHTGDILGGVEQLFEAGFLLGAAAVAG